MKDILRWSFCISYFYPWLALAETILSERTTVLHRSWSSDLAVFTSVSDRLSATFPAQSVTSGQEDIAVPSQRSQDQHPNDSNHFWSVTSDRACDATCGLLQDGTFYWTRPGR